jgi:hypothetical protein
MRRAATTTWKTNLSPLSPQILYCTIVISNCISLRYTNSKFVYAASSTESNKSSFISGISLSSPWSTLRHVFGTKNPVNLSTSTTKTRSFLDSELDFLQCVFSEEDDHPARDDINNTSSSGVVHQPQKQQRQQQEIMESIIEDSSTTYEDQQQQQDQEHHFRNSTIEQNSSNESPITKERRRRNAAFGLQEEEDVEETNESSEIREGNRGVEQQEGDDEEESLQYDYYYEYDESNDSLEEVDDDDDDDWNRLPQKIPFRQDDEEDLTNQVEKTNANVLLFKDGDGASSAAADTHTATLLISNYDAKLNSSNIVENDAERNNKVYMLQTSSLSLRQLRKTASKMTGMTGFFSGKQKQNLFKTSVTTKHNNFKDGNNSTVEEHLGDDELGVIRRRIAAIKKARDAVVNREEEEMRRRTTTTTTGTVDGNSAMGPLRWLAAKRRALSLNSKSLDLQQQQQQQQLLSRVKKNDVTRSGTKNQQSSLLLSEEEGIDLFREYPAVLDAVASAEAEAQKARTMAAQAEEERRKVRVSEINRQIHMAKDYLFELQSEKDDLLRRPNPFFNFTTVTAAGAISTKTKREFNFPSQGLVDEYIEHLVSSGRLNILNHTFLWKEAVATELDEEDDDIRVNDDLSSDARRVHMMYRTGASLSNQRRKHKGISDSRVIPASSQARNGFNANNNGGGGSWLLRQSIGKGESLGEKIGQVIETSTYKAVCKNVMSLLARSISSLHGLSILNHSSVRLYIESAPDLPPVGDLLFHGGDTYAAETLKRAIRRSTAAASSTDSGSTSIRKRKKGPRRNHSSKSFMDDNSSFLQHDAVVETLLSNCQISAPLLKLFPLPWQRALLANVVTLVLAVVNDFASGLRIQILGHTLTLSLEAITELDLLDQLERNSFSRALDSSRRAAEFEEAVIATASDLSEQLLFLDKWHERALGSGMLRAQIANLIARVVLTVSDDILSGTEINLWTKQASGPRVISDLEYQVI